jgi:hypothetical protein
MQFLIADTFSDSLARVTGDEQKAAKTTTFDLQMKSASLTSIFTGSIRRKRFWSIRVDADVRMIDQPYERQPSAC